MQMVRLFILILFTLPTGTQVLGQSPHWLWAEASNGSAYKEGNAVASDRWGNVFVAGRFTGTTASFGNVVLNNTAPPYDDFAIVKYDSAGNVLWARSAGGVDNDACYNLGITTDSAGNAYVMGDFVSPSISFGSINLFRSGLQDVFIVKYGPSGNLVWARNSVSPGGWASSCSISCSGGYFFASGDYKGNSVSFGSAALQPAANPKIFLLKYDTAGNAIWARTAGGLNTSNGTAVGRAVAADRWGNAYFAGQFFDTTITFGNFTLTNADTFASTSDIFIVKYDGGGNVLWAQSSGGNSYNQDAAWSVSCDTLGHAYLSGSFSSDTIYFGNFALVNADPSGNQHQFFLAKYDGSGIVLWAQTTTYPGSIGFSVSASPDGNVFLGGGFVDTISIGPLVLSEPVSNSSPSFIAQFDLNGNVICATTLNDGGNAPNAVCAGNYGNAYMTGGYFATPMTVNPFTLAISGFEDCFTAKFSCQSGLGITVRPEDEPVKVFPNPSSGKFTVRVNKRTNVERVEIYSVQGELLYAGKPGIEDLSLQLDLSSRPRGVYIVKLVCAECVVNRKIIIE